MSKELDLRILPNSLAVDEDLIARRVTLDDSGLFVELAQHSDINRPIDGLYGIANADEPGVAAMRAIEDLMRLQKEGVVAAYAIFAKEAFAGVVTFFDRARQDGRHSGYVEGIGALLPEHRKEGIIARTISDFEPRLYALEGVAGFIARISSWNTDSIRFAERQGFARQGALDEDGYTVWLKDKPS